MSRVGKKKRWKRRNRSSVDHCRDCGKPLMQEEVCCGNRSVSELEWWQIPGWVRGDKYVPER